MIPKKPQNRVPPSVTRLPTEAEKYTNYRGLIASYYDRGNEKEDIQAILKQITPNVDILNNLIEFEKSIDSLIKRKRFDLQELNIKPDSKVKKLLRIHVVSWFEKGAHKLKFKGYFHPRTETSKETKLSSLFKQISFRFSNDSYTNITWKKSIGSMSADRDGFIMTLSSSEKTHLDISMSVLSNPAKFKIDPYLQKIVKMETGTRISILEALWQYIKIHKLQDHENKESINTDQALKNAFKCEKIQFSSLNGRIRDLLTPCDPIVLSMGLPDRNQEKIFDIVVELDSKPKVEAMPFLAQKSNETNDKASPQNPYFYLNGKIKKIEKTIQENIEKIRRHALKRQIYRNFSKEKIQEIVAEQHELLEQLNNINHNEDPTQMNILFHNEEQIEKEVKSIIEQASLNKSD